MRRACRWTLAVVLVALLVPASAGAAPPLDDLPDLPKVQSPNLPLPPGVDKVVDDTVNGVNGTVDGVNDTVDGVNNTVDSVTGGGEGTAAPGDGSAAGTGGGTGSTTSTGPTADDPGRQPDGTTGSASKRTGSRAGGGAAGRGSGAGSRVDSSSVASGAGPAARAAARRAAADPDLGSEGGEGSIPDRLLRIVERVPWWARAALGILAAIALLMTGRSAWFARLTDRLARQGRELRSDVTALQSAIVSEIPARIGGVGVSVAYRPAGGPAAGGDLHDVFGLSDGRLGIVVGDVSGHGREALTATASVRYTVRAYLEAGLEPRHALRLADETLSRSLDGDFATVVAASYDPFESVLEYASAGHPFPIVLGGGPDHALELLTAPPIGIGPPTGSRQTRVSVGAGTRILLYTDGLVETHAGEHELLGRQGLIALLGDVDARLDAERILERLTGPASPPSDDMTACLLEPRPSSGGARVVEQLEIDAADGPPEELPDFLSACGLGDAAAGEALERIHELLGDGEPATLVSVTRAGSAVGWEVTGCAAAARATAADPTPVG